MILTQSEIVEELHLLARSLEEGRFKAAASQAAHMLSVAQPVGLSQAMLDEIAEIWRLVHDERVSAVAIGMRIRNVWPSLEAAPPAPAGEPVAWLETFWDEDGGKETKVWLVEPKADQSTISIEPLDRRAATPPQAQAEVKPSTLPGMIAAIYGELDRDDCAWIDGVWARMRGYILPKDGTSTLQRSGQTGADELSGYHGMTMKEVLYEIANRAANMGDDDAVEWMPSIYSIACEAVGEDPAPTLKALGFDGNIKDWPTRRSPGDLADKAEAWDAVAAAREDERSKCAAIAERFDDCGGQFIAQKIRDGVR